VGGPLFAVNPDGVSVLGADLVTSDAHQAPALVRLHLSSGAPLQ